MIDGKELPDASESFDSGIAYQRNWWYYTYNVVKDCTPVSLNHAVVGLNKELKHMRFWDADSNRRRTFRMLDPNSLPDFYTTHLLWVKYI